VDDAPENRVVTTPRRVALGDLSVVLVDAAHDLSAPPEGAVVVCGDAATLRAARTLLRGSPRLVALHDGGVGKDGAGVAGLDRLGDVGIAAVAVAHDSARIGDSDDLLAHGVIAHLNGPARALGLREGPLRAQLVDLGRTVVATSG
jgi:hypothetical protein